MTILSEIQKWAEKLPAWQQHAVAVLYERPTPSVEDLEDILVLLQDAHGIPDPVGRKTRKLTREQVAAPQAGRKTQAGGDSQGFGVLAYRITAVA